jgi:outer membrane protein
MSYQIRFSHVAIASLMAALLMVALLATPVPPAAASDGTVKIAVVDTEKILTSSKAGNNALAALKQDQEKAENQLKRDAQEIKDIEQRINAGSVPPAQLAQFNKQLADKRLALSRAQDEATRNLTKKRDEMLGQIDVKVMPVINQFGKEMGYTAVFRKFESGLIYADDSIDVTALIIQRLDAGQ